MFQIALIVIGGYLVLGGARALARKSDPEQKRKTRPGVAIAMIVIGILVVGFATFGIERITSWSLQPAN